MAGVSKINYKGKEILFIDYQGTNSDEEMIKYLLEAQQIIIKDNKPYLQLVSFINAFATPGYMKKAKEIAKETPKLAIKRAIVGIDSPGRKILLRGYNMIIGKDALKPFDTLQEAKDWLVS